MLDRTAAQGVTIAIQNGGGIRASIDAGVVTMGEVLTVLPFQNTLATFQLTGQDLKASIEQGLSEIEEGKGKFPQVAGLKFSFDKSVAPNEGRLKSIETMENGAWVPLDDAKVYTIATNNFVRGGGDGYKLFATNAQNAYDFGPGLEQVVADYLAANRPYTPKLDGRIAEVAAPAAAEEKPAEAPAPAAEAAPAAAPATAETTIPELPAMSSTLTATPPTVPVDEAAAKAEEEAKAAAMKAEEEAKAAAAKAEEEKLAAEKAAAEAAAKAEEEAKAAAMKAEEEAKAAAEKAAAEAAAKAEEEAKAAAAKAEEEAKAAAAPAPYVIARGDNYWNLSRKFYGKGSMWKKLQEANPDYNPNDLPIGASLVVPPAN
jgi:5'-nucleotidase